MKERSLSEKFNHCNFMMIILALVYLLGMDYPFPSVTEAQTAPPPAQAWIAQYNGLGSSGSEANKIATDTQGNVYVTGYGYNANGNADYVTVKYGPNGNQLWVARYNNGAADYAAALAVDSAGNVYVTGKSHNTLPSPNDSDGYATIKYGPNGNQLWVARYDTPYNDLAASLTVDGAGNVYVTGTSYNGNNPDYATVKYGPSGNQLWVARYASASGGYDSAIALGIDGAGNVYVTGSSYLFGYGDIDFVTLKYSPSGTQLWLTRYDGGFGGFADTPTAFTVDNAGNSYVTGSSVTGGINSSDYTTVKYNTNGTQLWVARYGMNSSIQSENSDYATALAVDSSGNVYVTGVSSGGSGGSPPTFTDYATIKYAPNGTQLWVSRYNNIYYHSCPNVGLRTSFNI